MLTLLLLMATSQHAQHWTYRPYCTTKAEVCIKKNELVLTCFFMQHVGQHAPQKEARRSTALQEPHSHAS